MNRRKNDHYTIRHLGPEALSDILLIQQEALTLITDARLLRANSVQMLTECLAEPHSAIGAFSQEGEMAAFAILYVPGLDDENIALSAGWTEEEAAKSCNLKLVIVRPAHRGQGLQRRLMNILEQEARTRGFSSLWATVSPMNTYSRRNIIACGYHCVGQHDKYGGMLRDLFCKTINN